MAATQKSFFNILAYTSLEWILILMILLNSFFSYLIRKFATYNSLKPPCFWCSSIDHLLERNNNINPHQNLICESHETEFLNLQKTTEIHANSFDNEFNDASKIKEDCEDNEMVEALDLHDENTSTRHIQVFDQFIPLEWTDSPTSCSTTSSCDGDENMVIRDEDYVNKQENKEDKAITIDRLMAELRSERLLACGLYMELDEERNASAISANHAMTMITKLQEEKLALQIESVQNQRMMEEQAEYDLEVLHLLNELVMKLENDKIELENELEMYKDKLLDYEGKKKDKMMPPCTNESLDDTNVLDLKNLRWLEESIVEFKEVDETLMRLTNDLNEDLVGKPSLEGGNMDYERKRVRVFDMSIDREAEASHSAWSTPKRFRIKQSKS